MCVNNLPKVVWVKVERPGVEPASFYVTSQHRNHCSMTRAAGCREHKIFGKLDPWLLASRSSA